MTNTHDNCVIMSLQICHLKVNVVFEVKITRRYDTELYTIETK